MSERELKEEEINRNLEKMMENTALTKTEQLFAKLIFNLRYDVNELKLELLKVFMPATETDQEEINRLDSLEDHGGFYSWIDENSVIYGEI